MTGMEQALDGDPPCTRSSFGDGRTASPLLLRRVEAKVVVDGDGSGRDSTLRRLEEHQRDPRNTLVAVDWTGEGRRRLATEGDLAVEQLAGAEGDEVPAHAGGGI